MTLMVVDGKNCFIIMFLYEIQAGASGCFEFTKHTSNPRVRLAL